MSSGEDTKCAINNINSDEKYAAQIGYSSAIQLWCQTDMSIWSMIAVMMVTNGIMFGAITHLFVSKQYILVIAISFVSIFLCIVYSFFLCRNDKYKSYFIAYALQLEKKYYNSGNIKINLAQGSLNLAKSGKVELDDETIEFNFAAYKYGASKMLFWGITKLFAIIYFLFIINSLFLYSEMYHPLQ